MNDLSSKSTSQKDSSVRKDESPILKALDSHFLKYYPNMKPSVLKAGPVEMHEVGAVNTLHCENAFAGLYPVPE